MTVFLSCFDPDPFSSDCILYLVLILIPSVITVFRFLFLVVFFCLPDEDLHRFVMAARDKDMTNGDYVFFYYNMYASSITYQPWKGRDGVTEDEKAAYQAVKMVGSCLIYVNEV